MSAPFLVAEGIHKAYFIDEKRIDVLRGLSLSVNEGELVTLVGQSGSGKSTLLHILGALDVPLAGSVQVGGKDVLRMSDFELGEFRNQQVGFVFQSHFLLPEFSAIENVMMPALLKRVPLHEARTRAKSLLELVGLSHREGHRPSALSGGESQRVALARAFMMKPRLLLADEPTGNLDPKTGDGIFDAIREMNRELKVTCLIVTHNEALASAAPRCLRLKEGRLVD